MPTMRDRIIGGFIGVGIGDGLGMPVETMTPEKIARIHPEGKITTYLVPDGHKWYNGQPAGKTTDDTQLTLATAEALIESNGITESAMDCQVKFNVKAMNESTLGWGGTTKSAVRNLANGYSWRKSGVGDEGNGRGKGNGPQMKLFPVAVCMYHNINRHHAPDAKQRILLDSFCFVRDLTLMTHKTEMAICASFAQVVALLQCFDFEPQKFSDRVTKASAQGVKWAKQLRLEVEKDDITASFAKLKDYDQYDLARISAEFGGGSCYCYHSVPFTFMHFLKNPDIEGLFNTVSAGGDADTNGSMIGCFLGIMYGTSVFPEHLISGLDQKDKILAIAEEFCDFFGIY